MPRRKHIAIKLDGIAGKLGAEVYNESSWFVCILPIDVHESVIGKGASVAEAVSNWDINLQAHLRNATAEDVVVLYVKDHISGRYSELDKVDSVVTENIKEAVKKTREQNITEFESQFYARKKG